MNSLTIRGIPEAELTEFQRCINVLYLRPRKSCRAGVILTSAVVIGIAVALHAFSASAQTARDVKGATPLVAIQDEAPVRLIVDPPIPEQLALGRVFIQYRTENLRIIPVYGKGALAVSPRIGHLHYYVDDQSWPIIDSSGETEVLVGLAPGPHKVRLELADTLHRPIPGASKVWSSPSQLRRRRTISGPSIEFTIEPRDPYWTAVSERAKEWQASYWLPVPQAASAG
jgi:hypothetical protein